MSEQLYRVVRNDEIKQEGDLFWSPLINTWEETGDAGTEGDPGLAYIRPVDPQPVNPWIKGSDSLPLDLDADANGYVEVWNGEMPVRIYASDVLELNYWRKIDQTPPPAEPTEAELFEKLLTIVESRLKNSPYTAVNEAMEVAADIRNLQESEGRDE